VSGPVPIAFYAPLKSPAHPSPSGDRTMARLLLKALAAAGFAPQLASEVRTYDGRGELALQAQLREESLAEADRLIARYRTLPAGQRPRAWFTYHVYYKAPDWLGPRVAEALAVPYLVAEGSRAAKRAAGPWALGHAGSEAALDRADVLFVMTEKDRMALERQKPERQRLLDLPPFVDLAEWGEPASNARTAGIQTEPARLLTVAMMRRGDKLASYRILAEALSSIAHLPWSLDVVGDGEARGEVEQLFAGMGERVRLHGRIDDRATLRSLYERADLFVWPAVNEAYGMVLLEAQAFGCPVVAGGYGGVASVLRDRETGLLTAPGDSGDFAAAVAALIQHAQRRIVLGKAAQRFVTRERTLHSAAAVLRDALAPLLGAAACA
jgi:glycosyltransferase involved in cell wall biosynthesis